jgi:hypothetical protein
MLSSLALLFAASAVASTDAPAHRIVFKRGAVTADVGGRLTGMGDTLRYVLKARAGQHMQISMKADGATRGSISFPNGDEEGGPDLDFDGILPADGDYLVTINENPMGESGKALLGCTCPFGDVPMRARVRASRERTIFRSPAQDRELTAATIAHSLNR